MRNLRIPLLTAALAGSLLAQAPEISFDAASPLKMPEHIYMGEAAGVATTSKGNVVVYTRTGSDNATMGGSRTFSHGGSRLFEFDPTGKFLREIGEGVYGFLFAQSVKVDPKDNIWVVDRGSSMVIEFDPQSHIILTMGRKPEAINEPGRGGGGAPPAGGAGGPGGRGPGPAAGAGRGGPGGGGPGGGGRGLPGAGTPGDNFNRPTDVTWDTSGNIFVADGYGNSRIAKFDKNGKFVKSWGSKGAGPGEFDTPLSIAADAQGNVYVADHGNKRIQVFDNNGTFKSQIGGVGSPAAICISPGAHPYLFSSNSNDPSNLENGEIYKMELDGKILGKFGKAGRLAKEFGAVNEIDCRNPNELYVGELTNWRVQKVSLK